DATLEQCLLELLDEDAASTDLAERARPVAIARRRDRHERDLHRCPPDPLPAQRVRGAFGLGQCEPTAAGADAKQHSGGSWCAAHRRGGGPAGGYGRMRSAPAAAAASRRSPVASRLLLLAQSEQVAHDVSIDHTVRA